MTANPPRGESLLGGHTVSRQGYVKRPEKSREDFPTHAHGRVWFHTSDLCVMEMTGALRIVGRGKKISSN